GVNFSIFSKYATGVELVLFDHAEDTEPSKVITLDPRVNKTYHYWHIFVDDVKHGQLYGYRLKGAYVPERGLRFDKQKVMLDPYARVVVYPDEFVRRAFTVRGKISGVPCLKSMVADMRGYDWEGDAHPRHPFNRTVIYEMHVAGFTKSPSSGVAPELRGTYAGLIEKIPYLAELGITAVELLPVFQFDPQDAPPGLTNYWGYSPITFFAPHQGYSSNRADPLHVLNEFRDMVKALHKAGIEVILDVVFNHTSEGNEIGPTYCFKGIDNPTYYILEPDKSHYANFAGTGNTLNGNQSIVRRMIIDSLHFWVKEMHVDGFRFDLASILSRDEKGHPLENPPILWDIESDPILAGTKLIAEAWDAAGLYQVGSFVGDSWKEWNGKFRDDIRKFIRGDDDSLSGFVTRMLGSPDVYEHKDREPEQSINFVTCHDGFTLNDLVSYTEKNNLANREQNRDGGNDNLSWNHGVEGPTDDPQIDALRERQIRNVFVATLLSIGAPMLLMGDEVRRSQQGNNNAYCQDNEISWFDWTLVEKHKDLFRFVKLLIASRLARDTEETGFEMSLAELLKGPLLTWHGSKLNAPDWSGHSHSIAFTVQSITSRLMMHYMFNAWKEPITFELPPHPKGRNKKWLRWLDTSLPSPHDINDMHHLEAVLEKNYTLPPFTFLVLVEE
ncbi:MAG TPA: glycogen debranching protein GlgX, partial [Phnomibacter sp.]|nr:glycogen debranching protein GlgX [Phnomibacter sp.]